MGYGLPRQGRINPRARALAERAEALAGARNDKATDKQAVTKDDAAQLGSIKLKSERVTAAPTMEQHNALVEDLRQIAVVLNAMGAKFTGI